MSSISSYLTGDILIVSQFHIILGHFQCLACVKCKRRNKHSLLIQFISFLFFSFLFLSQFHSNLKHLLSYLTCPFPFDPF